MQSQSSSFMVLLDPDSCLSAPSSNYPRTRDHCWSSSHCMYICNLEERQMGKKKFTQLNELPFNYLSWDSNLVLIFIGLNLVTFLITSY